MAGYRDGRLAGSCIRASVAAQQVQARSLDHSLISSCIPTVRRAACLVPIGRIISNCHDATTTSIPYSLACSTIKRYEHCDNGHVKFIAIYRDRFISEWWKCPLDMDLLSPDIIRGISMTLTFNHAHTSLCKVWTRNTYPVLYCYVTELRDYFDIILSIPRQYRASYRDESSFSSAPSDGN